MSDTGKRFAAHILYFDCEQFILKAIENCAPFVEKIYVAYSEVPWEYNQQARDQFRNSSNPDILKQSPYYDRIELVRGVWAYEEDQRNACLDRARADGMDYLIVHDADEFYSFADYRKNLEEIAKHPEFDQYKTPWYSFWKSLDYVMLYKDGGLLLGYPEFAVNCRSGVRFKRARCTDARNSHTLKGICFHLSYVLSDEQVWRKINTWGHAHQLNARKWFEEKWQGWHEGARNLHPVQPSEWKEAVRYSGPLPEVLRDFVSPQVTVRPAPLLTLALSKGEPVMQRLGEIVRPWMRAARKARLSLSWRSRAAALAAGPGLRLHLGCGEKRYENMLNCEYRTTNAADAVFDCSSLGRFGDGSVQQVYSHAFFEHLYRTQQLPLLKDCHRVLGAEGTVVFLGLPDFEVIARSYLGKVPSHLQRGGDFDLFHVYRYTHGDPEMASSYWLEQLHKSLFDKAYLAELLAQAGFTNRVIFNYCYPGEEIPLNLGFVASKSAAPLRPQLDDLLFPFRESLADYRALSLYEVAGTGGAK